MVRKYKEELVGEANYARFGNKFPLLIKFIDAKLDLSIQVHPGDELAKKRHNSFGKNEMWYVIAADQGAKLISGFAEQTLEIFSSPLIPEAFHNGKFIKFPVLNIDRCWFAICFQTSTSLIFIWLLP